MNIQFTMLLRNVHKTISSTLGNHKGLPLQTVFYDVGAIPCGCPSYFLHVPKRQPLKLRERPLIAMECTIIDERYMGLGTSEKALEVFLGLKRTCQQFNGDFTLLWHNSRLVEVDELRLYEAIV